MAYARKKRDYLINPICLKDKANMIRVDELDGWQIEIVEVDGSLTIRAGRQTGKTHVIATKASKYLLMHPGLKICCLSASERQAGYIYNRIKMKLKKDCGEDVFAGTPTMNRTILKNGSQLYCFPTGKTGDLIRGEDFDIIIWDECHYIPNMVFVSVLPMLDVARSKGKFGWNWALSTPNGDEGWFWDFCHDDDFKHWYVNGEDSPRKTPEDLEKYKRTLSKSQYMQEIQGEWVHSLQKVFSTELLLAVKKKITLEAGKRFLGADLAGLGADENAYVGVSQNHQAIQTYFAETDEEKNTFVTTQKIDRLIQVHKFRKAGLDGHGVGQGIFDNLATSKYPSRVVNLQNAKKNENTGRVIKLDMYSKAQILMEKTMRGEAGGVVIDEKLEDLLFSLDCMKFEMLEGQVKIYGKNSHLAEAFVRALWFCKAKHLNFWVHGF